LVFDITMGQKLAQRGVYGSNKVVFWPQNLAGPKILWENSVEAIF
jgi:hypothetical protein